MFDKNKYQIIDRQNEHTNLSSRFGQVPCVISNHLSGGSFKSLDNWFRSPNNHGSSADFCVTKDGEIYRYGDPDFKRKTWANGLTSGISGATAQLVLDKYYSGESGGKNSNNYTISIENESVDGTLTEAQFEANVWLHRWIKNKVKEIFGVEIPFDREHILGHNEFDKVKKYYCPGKFPFDRVLAELNKEEELKVVKQTMEINLFGKDVILSGYNINGLFYPYIRDTFESYGNEVIWNGKSIEVRPK